MADTSTDVPPWQLQYFSGSQRCDQLSEVLAPSRASDWLNAATSSGPVKRPGQLWLRLIRTEPIALSSSWIATAGHLSVKQLLVAFEGGPAKTLSRIKPERPFQFDNAALSVELPRNLVPGQSWLFCMTGVSKTGEISQAFLKFYPEAPFREKLLQRSQFDTACIAIIFAMALSALFFAVTLRDPVYLWYVGHIVAFAVFELRANFTLFRWLEAWPGTPLHIYMLGDLALGVSVFCSCKFALVFLDLPHAFADRPGWHRLVKWLERVAWFTLIISGAMILFRVPQLKSALAFVPGAQNVSIAIASILVLACAIKLS